MRFTKKQKKIGIIVIVILISILGIYLFGGFNKTLSTVGSYKCSGGQVLSISNAQVYTSDDLGGKKVIRVTFSTLPTSECLYVSLQPTDINSKMSDSDKAKFTATNTILGDIKLTKSQKVYNINERSTEIFRTFDLKELSGYNSITYPCWDNICKNQEGNSVFSSLLYSKNPNPDICYCAKDISTGINGEFSSSTGYKWSTQIDIGNDVLTLNQNTLSGKVGEIAFVKWSGNLVSNDNLEAITGRQAYKPYSDNIWRMIDYGTYTDLNNKYSNLRQNLIDCDSITGFCQPIVDNAFGFISESNQKLDDKLIDWMNGNNLVDYATINSNQLIVNLKSPIVYPTFTLDIDASQVGIFITSGIPQVTCPSSSTECITSGKTKDLTASLKNIGTDSGSFDYSLTCNKGSQSLQPSPPQQINAGDTKTITPRVGLTVESGTETSSCTFTARDINSLKSDSCSFTYCSKHQDQCIEGTKSCELGNKELWTCKSDGTYDKLKCDYGCWFQNGVYSCKGKDDLNNTGDCKSCADWVSNFIKPEDKKCKETTIIQTVWYNPFTWINALGITSQGVICPILLSVVAIVGLFTFLFGLDFLQRFKSISGKKKTWTRVIIALVLAIILAYVTYVSFWIGVIAFVIFLIIKFAYKKVRGIIPI